MAVATPPRPTFRWRSPWLIAALAAVVVIAGTLGLGYGTGLFRSGNQPGRPIASASPATPSSSPSVALRTHIPTDDSYLGLAVDGQGVAWFAETNSGRLGRYQAGKPITEVSLNPDSQVRTLRSAPDGSVWFAEPGVRRLGHITNDGKIAELPVEGCEFCPNWDLAVGPDGSVWNDRIGDIVRVRPDGTVSHYPVYGNGEPITIDSKGGAWIPAPMVHVFRISDSGQISEFKFDNGIEQVAEAADGHMWFVDTHAPGSTGPRIGWIDANGQTKFFNAVNADQVGFPNSIVRAPDGAVWFGTSDGHLIRLASETDVTVYNLPWPDAKLGPFVVLPGNHIVMVGDREVLEFVAANGTKVAGAQAIPTPLPYVPKDAAEAAAHAVAAPVGSTAKVVLTQSFEGDHAAAFVYAVNPNRFGFMLVVYVVEEAGVWRKYDSYGTQNLAPPTPGIKEVLKFRSGCLNVHAAPSKGSAVVACLQSGTEVEIDGLPTYADGYIWWHLVNRGWAAHQFLYCTPERYESRPEC